MSQLDKWRTLARNWQEQGPPATPSHDDTRLFVELLGNNILGEARKFGVLGSTPSLRNTIRANWPEAEISVIEFCIEMFHATSSYVEKEAQAREDLVEADWLELGVRMPDQFCGLLGDKALDNVSLGSWGDFFRSTRDALRGGGVIVLHVGIPNADIAGAAFLELAGKWAERLQSSNIKDAAAGLWEDLLSASASPLNRELTIAPFRQDLELYSQGRDPVALLSRRLLTDFAGDMDAVWTRFDLEDVLETAREFGLEYVAQAVSTDYEAAADQPLLAFRKSP